MSYGIVSNGEIVKEFDSLGVEYPLVSFPLPINTADLPVGVVEIFQLPAPIPSPFQRVAPAAASFNEASGRWERGWDLVALPLDQQQHVLDLEKSRKEQEIDIWRLRANESSFPHLGKNFSCDRLARGDIDWVNGHVAVHGTLPPGFPGGWKALDGTYIPIADVAAWNAFYLSIGVAGHIHYARSTELKAQVAAITDPATAVAQLAAIVW